MRITNFVPRQWDQPGNPDTVATLREESPLLLQAVDLVYTSDEVWLDNVHGELPLALGAVGAGLASVGALAWGSNKLLHGHGLLDTAEGIGALSLGGAMMISSGAAFSGHAHSGSPLAAGLMMVHGLVDIGVAMHDLRHAQLYGGVNRWAAGVLQGVKGASIVAAQLVPSMAPALHLVSLGAVVGRLVALHTEVSQGSFSGSPQGAG